MDKTLGEKNICVWILQAEMWSRAVFSGFCLSSLPSPVRVPPSTAVQQLSLPEMQLSRASPTG